MKASKLLPLLLIVIALSSCGTNENEGKRLSILKRKYEAPVNIPIDKGFSEYIASYTSGIVPARSSIEIHLTPEFAAKANKSETRLFDFDPVIKGKTEWKDETTIVFTPSKPLDQGKSFTGVFKLHRLGEVTKRLKEFPLSIQTLKKDFRVSLGALECTPDNANIYTLKGEVITSDFIEPAEAETFIESKLGRKKLEISWDHTADLSHKFTIKNIEGSASDQELTVSWDGNTGGVKQKGSTIVRIPANGKFTILDVILFNGESQKVDIVFSEPIDPSQDLDGLVFFTQPLDLSVSINSNIVTVYPGTRLAGSADLNVDVSVKNFKGSPLPASFTKTLDFTAVPPGIKLEGNGVILPASQNLIFPFKAANLRAVDLKIIKIFENNLPRFLQENEIDGGYNLKQFGRPVYSGRVDLVNTPGMNSGGWNLYTIDLSDYITVEPGILYKVYLGMRKSYSLYPCSSEGDDSKYEEMLANAQEAEKGFWDDPESYYNDSEDAIYYNADFRWKDRNDPCKEAYFSPDRKVSRSILASNFGIIAKKGLDDILHVMVNDLLTAIPVNEATVEVYDYQMQLIVSGTTNQEGSAAVFCERKPFLVIVKKDKDRNYLKTNDGSSLSLSSFDVSGNRPENGIKAFIYGERDVWRPGDSIFLSIFIKDMKKELPSGHPVQFELINPMEQRVDNQVQKAEGSNLLIFNTRTSPDAKTGNYKAVFKIGGATFTKKIRVESIKPNRLKITLAFADEILGGSAPAAKGTLNVKWLNGTIAKNLKSSVEYILKHSKTEFAKYGQYTFDDPVKQFNSQTVSIFNSTIDDNGNASVTFDPGKEIVAPGMLSAVFTAKSMEPGGDESITQAVYKYAPYPVFAGINLPALKGKSRMLFTDADNELKIVTLNEKGIPVNSDVEISVYKISYRWWWESDQEDLAYFIRNENYKPVILKTITTKAGEGSFTFKIGKEKWGRYLIRATVPGGHSTGKIVLIDWPWEYGMKGSSDGATLLSVNTDKEKYNPGDEIKLSFPSPENSRAIITLENSTGVLEEIRAICQKGNTVVSFRAKPEMAPNVYAYVSVIQPHAQTVNDMPMRLYGIAPVMVEDPDTRLQPKIDMPAELRSQKPFVIKVSESANKAMSYTLAVVDEGLLDITGHRTPDPWNYFYAREALGVQTWDLYDYILGAYGGTLDRILSVGGDEFLTDKSANKARRFKPVVKFLGPFELLAGKTNLHALTLPQYTGSVRAMVIAGNERSFGIAEKTVAVKDPLMVLVTAPRVVSPGEKVALPVTLFVQKEGIKEVTVKVEGNELLTIPESSRKVPVSGTGEKNTEFSFTSGENTGVARIKVTATGGGESAAFDLEFEVRAPNPPEARAESRMLRPGEKWETSFQPFGIKGYSSAVLEASSLPSVNLGKNMEYLLNYPNGCSEQITSIAFPQLWIKALTGDDAKGKTASFNISRTIEMLISRQMASGGIALWPNSASPDTWVSSYAGHFITEAERLGYRIPQGFKQKWISFQKRTAHEWRYDTKFRQSANDQAYRLFTLALAGVPEKGAMNRLREVPSLPALSRWLLAAAYATGGRQEVAAELLDMRNLQTENEYQDYYYGSEIRDKSIILYTLTLLKKEEEALPLLKDICELLNGNSWYSTQSIAWGLFSYMKWSEMVPVKSGTSIIKVNLNGEKSEQTILARQLLTKDLKMKSVNNTLLVENTSENPLYLTLIIKGIPLVSDMLRQEKGLSMQIDYLDMNLKGLDQRNLVQGTDFMIVAKVTNTTYRRVENIAFNQMVPSGWEIQNTRLAEASYGIKESTFDYRDIRDDRVNTYFSLNAGETKTFTLILNAAYKGEFYQPAVWCEAMYTPDCYSRFPGTTVKVSGGN